MATVQQLEQTKKRVELLKQEKARAEGAVSQLLTRLKSQYGCNSVESAKARLEELVRLKAKAQEEFENAYDKFQNQHPEI